MIIDKRMEKLADNIVGYSCNVQNGENVLIEANGIDSAMVSILIRKIYEKGGKPFVRISDSRIKRELLFNLKKDQAELMAKIDSELMKNMQCYIGFRGGDNNYELSDLPSDKMQLYSTVYSHPVHHNLRVKKTKWVILRYPTQGMSQLCNMSTEAFEDFYFDVCNLDYRKMAKAMDPLVELMNKTDKVRIVSKGTDLTFSIKGIPAIKCSGEKNIPDGEVYTAPVKDSVNGVIRYNVPSIENGMKFENVNLVFENGKIVKASANLQAQIEKIFDTDEGARYVGEFSFGLNPYIVNPVGDILFDEKISGSIHFTPGSCYDDADNKNQSAIHWDLVLVQTEKYGGGEIYFDDKLIRKNGIFVLDELKCLNPENLK